MKRLLIAMLFVLGCAAAFAEKIDIPDLELTDVGPNGIPKGWQLAMHSENGVCRVENRALRIIDNDKKSPWGICKTLPVNGSGLYVFSVEVSGHVKGKGRGNLMLHGIIGNPDKRNFSCGPVGDFNKVKPGEFTKIYAAIVVKTSRIKSAVIHIETYGGETGDYLVRNAEFSVYPLACIDTLGGEAKLETADFSILEKQESRISRRSSRKTKKINK